MKKHISLIFFIIALILATQLSAFAIGFETESVSVNEGKRVENRISFSTYNAKKRPFSNFDVSEEGMIALVSESGTVNPVIYVYDREGKFQYKYTVDTDGVIYAEWEGEDLWIYIVRGDHAVLVDNKGTVLKVESILNTPNNTSHWSNVWKKKKAVGDETYAAKTGLGVLGLVVNEYGQIVLTNTSGEAQVLYDVSSALWKKALITIPLIALLIFVVVSVIILVAKNATRYQNKIHFGSPYREGDKKNFYDRILDTLEKKEEPSKTDDENF